MFQAHVRIRGAANNGPASSTRDRSRMREFRSYGSVRGAPSNGRPYRTPRSIPPPKDRFRGRRRTAASGRLCELASEPASCLPPPRALIFLLPLSASMVIHCSRPEAAVRRRRRKRSFHAAIDPPVARYGRLVRLRFRLGPEPIDIASPGAARPRLARDMTLALAVRRARIRRAAGTTTPAAGATCSKPLASRYHSFRSSSRVAAKPLIAMVGQ